MLTLETLSDYQVDPQRGFLPARDPLDRLPPAYAAWDRLSEQLPTLLMARRARAALDALPLLEVDRLDDAGQWQRAMVVLSAFANAYVWEDDPPAARIPPNIAVPLCRASERLGLPPIVTHATTVLYNWRRLDPAGPIELGNLGALQLFLGGLDEQWFYLATVAFEARGAPALPALVELQQAAAADCADAAARHLATIAATLAELIAALVRIYERCDPHIFYHRVRRYLTGWNAPGVVYEGVSDAPQVFVGGSAAQSALIQALDAGLDIEHRDRDTRPFLLEMRRYMLPPHRGFVEALERGPSVRQFVIERGASMPVLRDRYNDCIRALEDFRRRHVEIAVRYITHQAPKDVEAKGTGGTNFAAFLGKARKETGEREIT